VKPRGFAPVVLYPLPGLFASIGGFFRGADCSAARYRCRLQVGPRDACRIE